MLILTHTDGFRIDLDEFSKGILQTPRNGHRTAVAHVQIGQFGRRRSGSRINGSSRFAHHNLRQSQFGMA